MTHASCAIVGGGIAGASVAYHLGERGVDDVVLLERNGELAAETTPKSFALFGMYGDGIQYELKRYAMRLYNRFAAGDDDVAYERIGHLSVATTEEVAEGFRRAVSGDDGEMGIFATGGDRTQVEFLRGTDVHETVFAPTLSTQDVAGAVYRPNVGYFDPVALTRAFLDRATQNGVEIRRNAEVTDVRVEGGEVTGLTVDGSELPVDSVVLAAGPWTAALAETAGIDLPVRHSLAPVLKLGAEGRAQTVPSMKHHESNVNLRGHAADGSVYVGHHQGGYEHGSRLDPDRVPSAVPEEVRSDAFSVLERLFPSVADAPVVDEWVGVRSLTPDGNPIVGETSVEGLSVIAFNTSGIQLAPGVGRLVASQLTGGEPSSLSDALSIDRFEGDAGADDSVRS